MNSLSLFWGILPLLIFVIVDLFAGLKVALILTVLMAIAEAIVSYYLFKEWDFLTIASLLSVMLFAAISYIKKSALMLKLQPALVSLLIALVLIGSYLLDEPLLVSFAVKYQDLYPDDLKYQLTNPAFLNLLRISTLTYGLSMLAHAAVTTWAAFRLNNWWWLFMRGVGFYVLLLLATLASKLLH
jgi:intracellular septation protein A